VPGLSGISRHAGWHAVDEHGTPTTDCSNCGLRWLPARIRS
jgi:hypothetical protein